MTDVIREPGRYAVMDGTEVRVDAAAQDYVLITRGGRRERHEIDDLDDLLSVNVRARWKGAEVAIGGVEGDVASFYTWDRDLAEREGLAGDVRDGWGGIAPVSELTDVTERVSSIHPRRREP
jgi:hypothetical protein